MAFDLDNLAGHVGEVLCETRQFQDDWGLPGLTITGVVLRGDHPEWRQHLMDLLAARPESERSRRVVNERVYAGLEPKGFRRHKKLSEGEQHERMLEKLAEKERLAIEVYTLREQKPGIASILCRRLAVNGETIVRRKGIELDLSTVEGRAALLDHETWTWEEGGEPKELAVPVYKKDPAGAMVLDRFEEPEKNTLGGWNLGDAIAKLLVDESEDLAAFVQARKADALEPSGPTRIGSTVTGFPSQPQNDA